MKRMFLLVIGYYLYIQTALCILNIAGKPEYGIVLIFAAVFSGLGARSFIRKARTLKPIPKPEPRPHYSLTQAEFDKLMTPEKRAELQQRAEDFAKYLHSSSDRDTRPLPKP